MPARALSVLYGETIGFACSPAGRQYALSAINRRLNRYLRRPLSHLVQSRRDERAAAQGRRHVVCDRGDDRRLVHRPVRAVV